MSCKVGHGQGFSTASESDRFEAVRGVILLLKGAAVRDVLRDWVISTANCFDISLVRRTLIWRHRRLSAKVLQPLSYFAAILSLNR